jgi:outer membrane protein TolC
VGAQQPTNTYSLKEAQEFALENNLEKKNASIDVDIAKRKVWETTALGLPQISSGVDFQFILNELPSLSFPGPDGTPIKVSVGEKTNATFNITASQLVFSGPYIVGLQATKAYKSLTDNALIKTERDLKSSIASAYYTILLLKETNEVLDSSVTNLRQTLTETQEMQKAGFVEEIVADQVRVSLSMVENSARETTRQLQSAKNLLKFQMGVESDVDIQLTEDLTGLIKGFAPDINIGTSVDPDQNIDLMIMANQLEVSNLQLKLEKSNFLPSLSAFMTLQKLAKEPEINFTPTAIAGVSVSLPIFSSGMRRSKVQQAKLEVKKSVNTYDLLKQSLDMELSDAMAQFSTAWEKYQSEVENKALAAKVYQNFRVKYSKGMASQQDLIQANDKHLQAIGNYMGSVFELVNAKLRVDKVLGNI